MRSALDDGQSFTMDDFDLTAPITYIPETSDDTSSAAAVAVAEVEVPRNAAEFVDRFVPTDRAARRRVMIALLDELIPGGAR